ncbi:uncharacterized protein SOCEGT47_028120 [Sorangium cellulosum]|uniref:Uncharacterized protein n=1 Tax=Sorangium cellulosum TaxID=56 RepID=A0A4P2PZX4_SORCE|nr:uncharacterized protein SOCEGT47_028120 [Sorangium cellulosum]
MVRQTRDLSALSALAQEQLERLGLRRLAEWTASPDELSRELSAMGWPCSEAVLSAEKAVGGLGHPPNGVFGIHASLRYLRGEVRWDRDDLQEYGLCADPRDPSRKVLPVWMIEDPRVWLALDGCVLYGSHIDGPEYFTLAFEDVCHYWETLALLDCHVVAFNRPHIVPRPRLESSCFVGEAIARELALTPFAPGTRGRTRAWAGPSAHVVELDIPGFKQGTDVVSDSADGIVLAAVQALDAGGAARITSPEALEADLLSELPVPTRQERPLAASHMYTWGKFLSYEDDRYRRRHRAS